MRCLGHRIDDFHLQPPFSLPVVITSEYSWNVNEQLKHFIKPIGYCQEQKSRRAHSCLPAGRRPNVRMLKKSFLKIKEKEKPAT
jgi:hypothetical protein